MKAWRFGVAALLVSSAPSFGNDRSDRMIAAQQIPWAIETPGQPQRLGSLWGERSTGPAGTLLKVPGGFQAPVHMHTADYRAVVVKGIWKHWPENGSKKRAATLLPGSYWTQKAREWHADACVSPAPCTILLINTEPYKTVAKK